MKINWRCKFCGFEIKDREDRRKIKMKEDKVYIIGFCDNCMNWVIFDTLSMDNLRSYIQSTIKEE